jgi:putative oxidoreductase
MLGLVPLRLVLGTIFFAHGYLKLFSPRLGPTTFAEYLRRERVPYPRMMAYMIGGLEVVGGVLVTLGVLVDFAAAVLAVHVFFALVTVGPRKGFTRLPDSAGYEYELVLLAGLLALVFLPTTPYSLGPYVALTSAR